MKSVYNCGNLVVSFKMSTSIWRVTSKTNEVYGMWLYIGKVSKGSLHGFMLSFGPFNLMIGKV